jgi:phosphoglycolate phosphatase-like HAD superfamily hydrolase
MQCTMRSSLFVQCTIVARPPLRIEAAIVVGDSIWDILAAVRCRAFGVGLLSGGYAAEKLRLVAEPGWPLALI